LSRSIYSRGARHANFGTPILARLACLDGAGAVLDAAFTGADARAGCVRRGDVTAIQADVDECVADLLAAVQAPATTTVTSPATTSTIVGRGCTTIRSPRRWPA
jgi:hypothetical protein